MSEKRRLRSTVGPDVLDRPLEEFSIDAFANEVLVRPVGHSVRESPLLVVDEAPQVLRKHVNSGGCSSPSSPGLHSAVPERIAIHRAAIVTMAAANNLCRSAHISGLLVRVVVRPTAEYGILVRGCEGSQTPTSLSVMGIARMSSVSRRLSVEESVLSTGHADPTAPGPSPGCRF